MAFAQATVKTGGRVVIPLDIRRKFQIDEGTRVAFLEEKGRLFIQPLINEFIDTMRGYSQGAAYRTGLNGTEIGTCHEDPYSVQVNQTLQQKKHCSTYEDQQCHHHCRFFVYLRN